MLQREKHEHEHRGGYELIYPLVSYKDEFGDEQEGEESEAMKKQKKYLEFME